MNKTNLNDFNNICRTCMNYCDIKYLKDSVISNIFYKLTEIHFETNDELPQQICRKCFDKINEIHEFSLQCKRSHCELLECLHKLKNPSINIKQELLEETNIELRTEEITIDEHDLELSKYEIFNPGNEYVIEELKIEKDVSEEKIIPESKDQNIDCFESILLKKLDKTVQNEGKTNDSANPNVSNKKTNSLNNNNNSDIECAEKNSERLKKNEGKHKCHARNKLIDLKLFEEHRRFCKRSIKCEHCSKSFERPGLLKQHMALHSSEHPLKCKVCSKVFSRVFHLKSHMRRHTGERPFKCEQCSQLFTQSYSLKDHMRIHTGERPYKCQYCPKTFTRSSNLVNHIRTHTGERPYKCEYCSKRFVEKTNLLTHQRMHTGERPFKCEHCSKTFKQTSSLVKHRLLHTGERPFQCEQCSKTFTQSSNLIKHRRSHTGERPFKCEHCSKAYAQSFNLIKHMCSHTGERPFKCEQCTKTFTQSSSLIIHRRMHTGERPYKCMQCSKTYAQSSSLRKHRRTHNGERSLTDNQSVDQNVHH